MYHQQYSPPPVELITVYGIVIGQSPKKDRVFLFYCKNYQQPLAISSRVSTVSIGRWLKLKIDANYRCGDYILDENNCSGFDDFDVFPRVELACSRFFPLKNCIEMGEVVAALRVRVILNQYNNSYELETNRIAAKHFIDPFMLMEYIDYDRYRTFIVEVQASIKGWIVLKVHMSLDDNCDNLPDPVVPYNVTWLDQTNLQCLYSEPWEAYRQNLPLPSPFESFDEGRPTPPKSIIKNSTNERKKEKKEVPISERRSSSNGEGSSRDVNKENQVKTVRIKEQVKKRENEPSDIEIETVGVVGLRSREYDEELSEMIESEWSEEKPLKTMLDIALCVVVQVLPDCCVMYATKTYVCNVLLRPYECKNVSKDIKVGFAAYFKIGKRVKNEDDIDDVAPFSHIAVEMMPLTEAARPKIDLFLKSIRSNRNTIELRVEFDLTVMGKVEQCCEEYGQKRKDFFILTAINGLLVTIPNNRLVHLLSSKFTAEYRMRTWATRRKAIKDVTLHIGPTTKVILIDRQGNESLLPVMSDYYKNMEHGMK